MIGAVLHWKPRTCRLQLQFFSLCCVGIHYRNVMPFLHRIRFVEYNIYFVSNGMGQKRVVFTRASFRKGVRVPIGVHERFRIGSGGVVGVVFLRGWVGWGGGRQRNRQVNAHALSKTTL